MRLPDLLAFFQPDNRGVGGHGSFLSLYPQVHLFSSLTQNSHNLIQTTKQVEAFILPSSLLGGQANKK